MGIFLVSHLTAYTDALATVTTDLTAALPVVAVAALIIASGLLVLNIGFRVIKRFAGG